jgi:hypothetical protein
VFQVITSAAAANWCVNDTSPPQPAKTDRHDESFSAQPEPERPATIRITSVQNTNLKRKERISQMSELTNIYPSREQKLFIFICVCSILYLTADALFPYSKTRYVRAKTKDA